MKVLSILILLLVVGAVIVAMNLLNRSNAPKAEVTNGPEYWIQNSDFSIPAHLSNNEPVSSAEQVLKVLSSYDWIKQNDYEDQCTERNLDCAPAGIGIISKPGTILHICPRPAEKLALIHLHIESDLTSYENVPESYYPQIVGQFLNAEFEGAVSLLKPYQIN